MRHWTGAGFPLTLIVTLAALTVWLKQAVEMPEPGRDGKHRHDPDYIVEGARVTRLDDAGRLRYTMRADRIAHFPDDDSTEVNRPHLVYLNEGRPPMTLSSEVAQVSANGAEVQLLRKVEVRRAASERQEALLGVTDRLTVYPDDERAVTDAQVEITQGKSWVRGVGMELDNDTQQFVLKSKVTGQFEPKRTKTSGRS